MYERQMTISLNLKDHDEHDKAGSTAVELAVVSYCGLITTVSSLPFYAER